MDRSALTRAPANKLGAARQRLLVICDTIKPGPPTTFAVRPVAPGKQVQTELSAS